MSRKSKERKLAKMAERLAEKQQIEQRRQERVNPVYAVWRRFTLVMALTVLLLYVGSFVATHLPSITSRLIERGL